MHVNIHANARFPVADGHHQIGRLASDALQGEEFVDGIRHPTTKVMDQTVANRTNLFGLVFVKPDRINGLFDGFRGECAHTFRRVG